MWKPFYVLIFWIGGRPKQPGGKRHRTSNINNDNNSNNNNNNNNNNNKT